MVNKINNAGFHIHVYFETHTKIKAVAVYHAIVAAFPNLTLGRLNDKPVGPHTKPMFQVSISPQMFEPVVTWLMFNRDSLSVLVHPLSGDELADHTHNMLWLGSPVPLDIRNL